MINVKSQKISNLCCKPFLKYSQMLIVVDSTVHPLMFKVNSRNTKTRHEICSKLTIKMLKKTLWSLFMDGVQLPQG